MDLHDDGAVYHFDHSHHEGESNQALSRYHEAKVPQFSASVINGFGYSKLHTMLVGMPAGTCNTATGWIGALVPRMFPGTRTYTAIGLCFVPLLGAVLLMSLPREGAEWGIVVSTWLGGCSSALLSSSASIIASNVKGNTKKSIVSVAFFIAYCVGCIASPFKGRAPLYQRLHLEFVVHDWSHHHLHRICDCCQAQERKPRCQGGRWAGSICGRRLGRQSAGWCVDRLRSH